MATQYSKSGDMITVSSDASILKKLGGNVYSLCFHPQIGFHLIEQPAFKLPSKIYGKNTHNKDIIVNAFDNDVGRCTGVVLEGYQGTGKSLTATEVCVHYADKGVPVILIQEQYLGVDFENFLASIDEKSVILVDEFEKLYKKPEAIASLLRVLDGGIKTHKLWLLTANANVLTQKEYQYLYNRPSRIRYTFNYSSLDMNVVREYAEDNLVNKDYVGNVIDIASTYVVFTMDTLQALVKEINLYQGTELLAETLKALNIDSGLNIQNIEFDLEGSLTVFGRTTNFKSSSAPFSTWYGNPYQIARFLEGSSQNILFTFKDEDECDNSHNTLSNYFDTYTTLESECDFTRFGIKPQKDEDGNLIEVYMGRLLLDLSNENFVKAFNVKQDPKTKEMTMHFKDTNTEFKMSVKPIYKLKEPAFKFTL